MRRSLRETSGGPVSLFAFQDIIFSVTAVLLFATIWFALSTRVQRFSRTTDVDGTQLQLTGAIAAIAESEAALRLPSDDARVDEHAGRTALAVWSAHQLAAGDAERIAAELRERVQDQERRSARSVVALQSAEDAWADLQRRLPIAEQRAQASLLRVDAGSGERREPIVLVIGGTTVQRLTATGAPISRPISAATVEQEVRALIDESGSAAGGLWVGLRPSAGPFFDRLIAVTQAMRLPVHTEPIAEDQELAFHQPERARAVLE
jgi:hypothetical protein